jgi:hypothetical protein
MMIVHPCTEKSEGTFVEDLVGSLGLVVVANIRGKRKEKDHIDN